MTPNRPYLIRAVHEWLLDNECTPYLLVSAEVPGVDVPDRYVQEGKVILNISPQAVESLLLGNEEISFTARFSGVAQAVTIPVNAVLAIYAKENGRGMMFSEEEPEPEPDGPEPKPPAKPTLKVVK